MSGLAVITGASGGIGAAIASQLLGQGYSIMLTGRNEERLASLCRSLGDRYPESLITSVAADLTEEAGRQTVVQRIATLDAPLVLAVNNAGMGLFNLFQDIAPSHLTQVLATNVTAPILLTQAILERFAATSPTLQIVNIGSTFGSIGYPGFSGYCASKFALRGWSEALAREYADTGIRIRYFAPRATQTDLNTDAVNAMNRELGVTMDSAERVAQEFVIFLKGGKTIAHIGWPERFFVWLNKISPNTVSSALTKQLPIIRRHARRA